MLSFQASSPPCLFEMLVLVGDKLPPGAPACYHLLFQTGHSICRELYHIYPKQLKS